uniref:Putative ovule protein n=1 Tax=Solanum chacoense TaxID=4108 RepID=A0A0V0HBC8_SOLCH
MGLLPDGIGSVRRNYKHVLLVDVKEHLVLGDSLSQLKNRSPESVILTTLPTRKKNSDKKPVNSGFVFGGVRGVRRLANAMLTEIVRAITQHKKRNLVSESTLFNQLVSNEFVLKNVNLIVSGESTHELSSLTGLMNSNSKSGSSSFSISKFPIVRRGNSNLDISYVFKKYLCSSPLDSIAYSDC